MKVLVINCGSSTIKTAIIDTRTNRKIWGKKIENLCIRKAKKKKINQEINQEYIKALKDLRKEIKKRGIKIDAIGHRFVHGGDMVSSMIINKSRLKTLEKLNDLAPLHNPYNLLGLKEFLDLGKNVVVFDTKFHSTMPEENRIYPIPYQFYKKGIKRYGFHGINNEYVTKVAKQKYGLKNLIVCHLGSGVSITVVKNGKSIINSMGYTPLEGPPMSTRSGTIDPGIIFKFIEEYGIEKAKKILIEDSGWKGISGEKEYKKIKNSRDPKKELAIKVFINKVSETIMGYTIYLPILEGIIFTGGIGENEPKTRKLICKKLKNIGIKIDEKKNRENKEVISQKNSKVKVLVIKANEELMIAKEVEQLIRDKKKKRKISVKS